VQNLG
jgi:hypothetical protein